MVAKNFTGPRPPLTGHTPLYVDNNKRRSRGGKQKQKRPKSLAPLLVFLFLEYARWKFTHTLPLHLQALTQIHPYTHKQKKQKTRWNETPAITQNKLIEEGWKERTERLSPKGVVGGWMVGLWKVEGLLPLWLSPHSLTLPPLSYQFPIEFQFQFQWQRAYLPPSLPPTLIKLYNVFCIFFFYSFHTHTIVYIYICIHVLWHCFCWAWGFYVNSGIDLEVEKPARGRVVCAREGRGSSSSYAFTFISMQKQKQLTALPSLFTLICFCTCSYNAAKKRLKESESTIEIEMELSVLSRVNFEDVLEQIMMDLIIIKLLFINLFFK